MKKSTYRQILPCLLLAVILCSCNKRPTAHFSFNKSEYSPGEKVILNNDSYHKGENYIWYFPDGQQVTSTNAEYVLSNSTKPGTYDVKLEAFSKKGDKVSEIVQQFNVVAPRGDGVFWTRINGNIIQLTVDGKQAGSITYYYNYEPNCSDLGCVTINLGEGPHSFSATDGLRTWSGSINIIKNTCIRYEIK